MAAINLHRKCKTKTTVMYKEVSKRLRRRLREVAGSGCQADHVRDVLCRCGQSLYAIKVLRCHGMNEEELRFVYKSVVLAKLMYASPAWWGFATAAEKNAFEAFVQRGVRL